MESRPKTAVTIIGSLAPLGSASLALGALPFVYGAEELPLLWQGLGTVGPALVVCVIVIGVVLIPTLAFMGRGSPRHGGGRRRPGAPSRLR